MGAGALMALQLAPVIIDLLKSGKLQDVIAKVAPHLSGLLKGGKLDGLLGGDSTVAKALGSSLEGAGSPEQRIADALTVLLEYMPIGSAAEQYTASIGVMLNGAMGLRSSLKPTEKGKG